MNRKKHSVYRVPHFPWFWASTEGLRTYFLRLRGACCLWKRKPNPDQAGRLRSYGKRVLNFLQERGEVIGGIDSGFGVTGAVQAESWV